MPIPAKPRLLLIEDDAVSAAFLQEALIALPAEVEHVATLAAASAAVAKRSQALWLVDANLPDGYGGDWLRCQRAQARDTAALALTAEVFRDELDSLVAAGFREVLQKPLTMAALHAAVSRVLGATPAQRFEVAGSKQPIWDEAQALLALGGDRSALSVLRGMFLRELPSQRDAVLAALSHGDAYAARAVLHKLQASTAFVGAARLAQSTQNLSAAPEDSGARQRFTEAVSDHLGSAE